MDDENTLKLGVDLDWRPPTPRPFFTLLTRCRKRAPRDLRAAAAPPRAGHARAAAAVRDATTSSTSCHVAPCAAPVQPGHEPGPHTLPWYRRRLHAPAHAHEHGHGLCMARVCARPHAAPSPSVRTAALSCTARRDAPSAATPLAASAPPRSPARGAGRPADEAPPAPPSELDP